MENPSFNFDAAYEGRDPLLDELGSLYDHIRAVAQDFGRAGGVMSGRCTPDLANPADIFLLEAAVPLVSTVDSKSQMRLAATLRAYVLRADGPAIDTYELLWKHDPKLTSNTFFELWCNGRLCDGAVTRTLLDCLSPSPDEASEAAA